MTTTQTSLKASLPVQLSPNAERLLRERYYLRDGAEVVEDFPALARRVARFLAAVEEPYGGRAKVDEATQLFYDAITTLRLLPSSPILMNAGTAMPCLCSCFVLPVADSLAGIMRTLTDAMLIQKAGGGNGFSFSHLRPKGSPVAGTNGVASGPVPFIEMFDKASSAIRQGGRRHGANMAILRVDHPDIIDFIRTKAEVGKLPTFNFSVSATDAFLRAVLSGESYDLVDPRTGAPVRSLPARQVFRLIAEAAWRCGDPGVVFIDEINRCTSLPGPMEATNPCGEQPLEAYGACSLASADLSAHVEAGSINWGLLGNSVRVGVRLLDDAIDASSYPLAENEQVAKANRKIGLGLMGWAHMLVKLGVPYDSDEGVQLAEKLMQFVSEHAVEASRELAKERGPFPNFGKSVYAERGEPARRNATVTTVAPTGSISIIADTSSGIEPIFALAFRRTGDVGKALPVIDPVFRAAAAEAGILTDELIQRIVDTGSVQDVPNVPSDMKRLFKIAHEITPEWHVRMQAAIQKYTENAVSKTVNLPATATVEDVERVLLMAHEQRCKGVTVFRNGCRAGALALGAEGTRYVKMRERPKVTFGRTEKFATGCGKLFTHVNRDQKGLLEVFSNLGKGGGCPAQSEATARLVSLCLRCDVDPAEVVRQLRGIRCPTACSARAEGKPVDVLSCPDAVAQAIANVMAGPQDAAGNASANVCPVCGGEREPGRCGVCRSCGAGGCDGG